MSWYDRYVYWRLWPAARLVYRAFDNPDAWEPDKDYTITHKPSKVVFWVSNGRDHFKVYKPQELECFTKFERKVLWGRYEQWKTMYLFTRMAGMD